MFPAKLPACYQQEGSSRTFGLRINTESEQCLHGTPLLAHVQLVLIIKTYRASAFLLHFLFLFFRILLMLERTTPSFTLHTLRLARCNVFDSLTCEMWLKKWT